MMALYKNPSIVGLSNGLLARPSNFLTDFYHNREYLRLEFKHSREGICFKERFFKNLREKRSH